MTHQPPYPGGVITRFTGVTCLGILLAALVLLPLVGADTRQTLICACIATLLYPVPAVLSGIFLARRRACRDTRGILLAAASGACAWLCVPIAFVLLTSGRISTAAITYPAVLLAGIHAVAALLTLPHENSPTLHDAFKQGGTDGATLHTHPHRNPPMENTTQKLIIIAVISAILLVAVQLLSGIINDRQHYAANARENITQVDSPSKPGAIQTLDNRLDLYRLTERSSKYAVLFLIITFGGCFLFETAAYVLAALACNGLIAGYLSAVLGSVSRALTLGGILALAYAVLYLLLQSQEYTLLAGSLLLFAALAATMYGTRNFDWYNLKAKKED